MAEDSPSIDLILAIKKIASSHGESGSQRTIPKPRLAFEEKAKRSFPLSFTFPGESLAALALAEDSPLMELILAIKKIASYYGESGSQRTIPEPRLAFENVS